MSGENASFEILPGLPPYGEAALPFPHDPRGAFCEGTVVRFSNGADGTSWVGNFRRGVNAVDLVAPHPDGRNIIVIAGGDVYIVEPYSRRMQGLRAFSVESVVISTEEMFVFANPCEIHILTASGHRASERISWDGFKGLTVVETTLYGEAWSPISQNWHPFSLDLLTNEVTDGIYSAEMARAVRIFQT